MAFTHVVSHDPPTEFRDFAERLRAGDDTAYRDLMQRYANRLRALAAMRISPQLRAKYDAEDVLQSVLRNFFNSLKSGAADLESSQAMRGLLAVMVKRKCAQYAESFASAKRDVNREEASDNLSHRPECSSREPNPEAAVMLADTLAHWLDGFDEIDRQIVAAILQGESTASIAQRLHTSQRTVQRTVKRTCLRLGLSRI
jgi:RNA polymerase sigma factor (sigma-70 family)